MSKENEILNETLNESSKQVLNETSKENLNEASSASLNYAFAEDYSANKNDLKSELNDIDDKDVISPWLRPLSIFFSPIKTFKSIRKSPSIWFVYLLVVVIPIAFMFAFKEAYIKEMLEIAVRFNPMMADNRELLQMAEKTSFVNGLIGALVGGIIAPLISAAVIKLVAHLMHKEATYKMILSMVLHLGMIASLTYLINVVLVLVTGSTSLGMSVTSLGFLLTDGPSSGILYYLLVPFDILTIWAVVLKYYGLRIVADFSKKAATIYMIVFVIFLFAMSLLQYLPTLLMGA